MVAFPVTWEDPRDAGLSWEWDPMHFADALPPLAGDYVRRAIHEGVNYRNDRIGIPARVHCRIVNGYAYAALEFLGPETEIREQALASRREQSRVVRRYWDDKVFPILQETYRWMHESPVETAPPHDVAYLWDELWRRLPRLWGLHFVTVAGSYQSLDDLADLYESVVEGARSSDALALVRGLPNALHRVQRDLHRLAEAARATPEVAEAIVRDPDRALETLPVVPGGQAFLDALSAFLREHGHLGQPFDDPQFPSWQDEPRLLVREVRKRLLHPQEDPEARRLRLAADADALVEQARGRLRDRPEDLVRFEEALALARDVGPLTEEHNYWLDRMLQAHFRRFALRVGRRLVEVGAVERPEDVFYLYADEVRPALAQAEDRRAVVAERRAQLERWATLEPPAHLGRPPEMPGPRSRFDAPPAEQPDAGVLRGVGACAGTAHGPARVVRGSEDFARVQPGDVLICPSSNPSWVPLFGIIAGLVTDTGGVLSHAAVVAREFGVPAVVGTGEATARIRDGQPVDVDGTAGEVRIL